MGKSKKKKVEKWIKHYCSSHKILLVGEGDFSFAVCLATAFGSANNIVATSYDTEGENIELLEEMGCTVLHDVDANDMSTDYRLMIKISRRRRIAEKFDRIVFNFPHAGFDYCESDYRQIKYFDAKYKQVGSNLLKLTSLGAHLLFRVDATKMKFHTDLLRRKFDCIIFNFPHAGFLGKEVEKKLIVKHRTIVRGFLKNSSGMLRPDGEIHVNHKMKAPFSHWNLAELASESFLLLKENNKRGDGSKADEPFNLGKCSTYIFILSPFATSVRCLIERPAGVDYLTAEDTAMLVYS